MVDRLSVVGKRFPRTDAIAKAKGEAAFVPDIQLPGMLHAKTLRSPYPHAKIVKIDTQKAEALPGVMAVLTFKNVPKVHPRNKMEFLLNETVRYCGDEVAMVAAETREIAEEALAFIDVEYEVLPAVFDAEDAMQSEAPLLYPELESNIIRKSPGCDPQGWIGLTIGDIDKGFAEAEYIVEGVYKTPIQATVSPMPRATVCQWSGNKLTCWADTMVPMAIWHDIARCLDIPQSDVRLIVPNPVGSYGRKEPEKTPILTAILAKRTGRPVKTAFTREEDFLISWRRVNFKAYSKAGLKKDGTVTTLSHKVIANCGADAQSPLLVMATSLAKSFAILYRAEHVKSEGCGVFTNTTHHGAVLGFGDSEGNFCMERLMDEAAETVGMDPVEFRMKNCVRYGDACYDRLQLILGKDPRRGIVGPDIDMPQVITKAADNAGWRKKWRGWTTPVEIHGSIRRGIGFAMGMHHCFYKEFSAEVKMNHDGTASVLTGSVDHGQGCYTIIAQVVAETLGLRYEDVNVSSPDSPSMPAGFGNAGSSGTSSAVNAAKYAADDARRKLLEIAALSLGCNPDELDIQERKIFLRSNPVRCITIAQACQKGLQVTGLGLLPSPDSLRDEKSG